MESEVSSSLSEDINRRSIIFIINCNNNTTAAIHFVLLKSIRSFKSRWRQGLLWARITLALLGVVTASLLDPTPAGASFGFSEPRILRSDNNRENGNDFFADIKTDGKGTWMAVWYSFDSLQGTIGVEGDILYCISRDNGESWSAPAPVNTDAMTDSAVDIAASLDTDQNGTWVAVWKSGPNVRSATFSQDEGIWSNPIRVNSDANGENTSIFIPRVAANERGDFVCVWTSNVVLEGESTIDNDVLFSVSSKGQAWTPQTALNSDFTSDNGVPDPLIVPNIATDRKGTWLVTWPSRKPVPPGAGDDYNVIYSRCTDDSFKWTPVAYLNSNAVGDTGDDGNRPLGPTFRGPFAVAQGAGRWICVWNRLNFAGGPLAGR